MYKEQQIIFMFKIFFFQLFNQMKSMQQQSDFCLTNVLINPPLNDQDLLLKTYKMDSYNI